MKNARDIIARGMAASAAASGGGGGSGSGDVTLSVVFNMEWDAQSDTATDITSDQTIADIYQAQIDGLVVVGVYSHNDGTTTTSVAFDLVESKAANEEGYAVAFRGMSSDHVSYEVSGRVENGMDIWTATRSSTGGGADLPPVTSADNGKFLGVVDGEWGTSVAGFVETTSVNTVLAETTVTTTEMNGVYMAMVPCTYTPVDGEEMIVTFNNTSYDAAVQSPDYGIAIIGDLNISTGQIDFTRYPFILEWSSDLPNYVVVITESASTNTIKIEASTSIVSNVTPGFTKTVTSICSLTTSVLDSDEGTGILTKTAREILDMCNSGLPIMTYITNVSNATIARNAFVLAEATTEADGSYRFIFINMSGGDSVVFGALTPDAYPQYPFKIPFTIDNTTYYYVPDFVLWSAWVNSEDNTDGFYVESNTVYSSNGDIVQDLYGNSVLPNQGIGVNMSYVTVGAMV